MRSSFIRLEVRYMDFVRLLFNCIFSFFSTDCLFFWECICYLLLIVVVVWILLIIIRG